MNDLPLPVLYAAVLAAGVGITLLLYVALATLAAMYRSRRQESP